MTSWTVRADNSANSCDAGPRQKIVFAMVDSMSSAGSAAGQAVAIAESTLTWFTKDSRKNARRYKTATALILLATRGAGALGLFVSDNAKWPALVSIVAGIVVAVRESMGWHDNWIQSDAARRLVYAELCSYRVELPSYTDPTSSGQTLVRRVIDIEAARAEAFRKAEERYSKRSETIANSSRTADPATGAEPST